MTETVLEEPEAWVRPACIMCGKEMSDLELGLGLVFLIYPGCDHYNAGGFCTRDGFGKCLFEDDVLCEACLRANRAMGTIVYVGDACQDLRDCFDDPEDWDRDDGYHDPEWGYQG